MYIVDKLIRSFMGQIWSEHDFGRDGKIKVEFYLNLDAPEFRLPPETSVKLEKILDDLIINSVEAIYGKRSHDESITIEPPPKEGIIRVSSSTNKDGYRMEFEDNGPGVNPADFPGVKEPLEQIFEYGPGTKTANAYGSGGIGLWEAAFTAEDLGGNLYALGSSSKSNGKILTLGDHHGAYTGLIIRLDVAK